MPLDAPGDGLARDGRAQRHRTLVRASGDRVGRTEHQRHGRQPPAVHRVLRHLPLLGRAFAQGAHQVVALPDMERLLLADAAHGAGVRAVRRLAQRGLVDDRRTVRQPGDRAGVRPGERRVVEGGGIPLVTCVEGVEQIRAVDAERLCGGVQIEAVAGLVLDLGDEHRLAVQRRGPSQPGTLRLHADDLGMGVLGDLAQQHPAVAVGHPVARFDGLTGAEERLEVREETVLGTLRRHHVGASRHGRRVRCLRALAEHLHHSLICDRRRSVTDRTLRDGPGNGLSLRQEAMAVARYPSRSRLAA